MEYNEEQRSRMRDTEKSKIGSEYDEEETEVNMRALIICSS